MPRTETQQTRISDGEARRIRQFLERQRPAVSEHRREHDRYDCYGDRWIASLREPAASTTVLHEVCPWNLSRYGVGFFHHGYVHPGTECVLRLQAMDGEWHEITGTTVRCVLLEGMIYVIGFRTTIEVDVGLFCPGA